MLRHEKQKIKRWLYSSSSNWHFSSWWSTEKEHKNEKLELSSTELFSKRFWILLVTQRRTIITTYISIQLRYRVVCHLSIHTPNITAYKQHDYLLKIMIPGVWNRAVTSWNWSIEFIVLLVPVAVLISCISQDYAHACSTVAVYVHHSSLWYVQKPPEPKYGSGLLQKATIYNLYQQICRLVTYRIQGLLISDGVFKPHHFKAHGVNRYFLHTFCALRLQFEKSLWL